MICLQAYLHITTAFSKFLAETFQQSGYNEKKFSWRAKIDTFFDLILNSVWSLNQHKSLVKIVFCLKNYYTVKTLNFLNSAGIAKTLSWSEQSTQFSSKLLKVNQILENQKNLKPFNAYSLIYLLGKSYSFNCFSIFLSVFILLCLLLLMPLLLFLFSFPMCSWKFKMTTSKWFLTLLIY